MDIGIRKGKLNARSWSGQIVSLNASQHRLSITQEKRLTVESPFFGFFAFLGNTINFSLYAFSRSTFNALPSSDKFLLL